MRVEPVGLPDEAVVAAQVRASGLLIMLALAGLAAALMLAINLPVAVAHPLTSAAWRSFHAALKRLLVSDMVIRTCEGMAEIFIVLYVTNVTGLSLP